jgi:hypothetical protein
MEMVPLPAALTAMVITPSNIFPVSISERDSMLGSSPDTSETKSSTECSPLLLENNVDSPDGVGKEAIQARGSNLGRARQPPVFAREAAC